MSGLKFEMIKALTLLILRSGIVEEYPYFQEFYKKLFELLNEQIVYKKK